MSGPRRAYLSPLPADDHAVLTGDEAHHLGRVLRVTTGESVELFDGLGHVATANITGVSKRSVEMQMLGRTAFPAPPALTLAVAPPKGDRFDWLIEKSVEWGVTEFVPLITERGIVDPRDSKLDRLRQTVIEAAKQSRQAWLMQITNPEPLANIRQRVPDAAPLLFGDFAGHGVAEAFPKIMDWSRPVALIGPEGGWTEPERTLVLEAGGRGIRLGESILRTETAAIGLATAIQISRR